MTKHLNFCISLLGTLDIHGEPSRDISLSLRETTAPVRIEPGTKNITLTRKLDKEGIEGPSSVTFTVLCDKRNHNEPVGVKLQLSIYKEIMTFFEHKNEKIMSVKTTDKLKSCHS